MKTNLYMAAYTQADITPDFQVELVGFNRGDCRSKGIHSRLVAQMLLLKNECDVFCLLTVDNIGLSVSDATKIRHLVADCIGTTINRVMLCSSHTHSSPNTDYRALNAKAYMDLIEKRILECANAAKSKYRPCKIGWVLAHAKIGENRREGCSCNDDRVGLLRVADAQTEEPITVIARVTAHANVLIQDNYLISSDFFGEARSALEALFGCPIMLTQGAAGNVKPSFQGTVADLKSMAEMLKNALSPVVFKMEDICDLSMDSHTWRFFSDVPPQEQAVKIAADAMRCGIDGKDWLQECDRLRKEGIFEQYKQIEVQFLKINGGCLCGIPNEVFCEIALHIANLVSEPLLLFGGYTNGIDSYLPSREEWHKGGYEILYSHLLFYPYFGIMPYRKETAGFIETSVAEIWRRLNKS